jgi:hypothetical protein
LKAKRKRNKNLQIVAIVIIASIIGLFLAGYLLGSERMWVKTARRTDGGKK